MEEVYFILAISSHYSCYSLLDLVKAIIYLIENPNYDSPNNSLTYLFKPSQYEMAARRLLAGFEVGGHCYEPNSEWCKWAREKGCFPTEDGVENQEELGHEEEMGKGGGGGGGEVEGISLDESEEIESTLSGDLSFASSETVPSFAKIRYSIEDQSFASQELYFPVSFSGDFQKNRITIHEPGSKRGTIFYFIEMLGHYCHQEELGNCYKSLFSTNVVEEYQMDRETRQTSQSCHWQ
ncbi:unnamed protein product, partial [Hymenolepis diminuta]|uniref:Repressor of RNA polymerase III transcription MAF1 homolog n=1 Tax=Hymenolepis diminuta TaxID=6216 RepID=A0A0R3SP53_HYMDI